MAQNNLGVTYANGDGVRKNFKQAAKWYRRAADQGAADAQSNLGLVYHNGIGVRKDYQLAANWWHLAADQGNLKARELYDELRKKRIDELKMKLMKIPEEIYDEIEEMINLHIENPDSKWISLDESLRHEYKASFQTPYPSSLPEKENGNRFSVLGNKSSQIKELGNNIYSNSVLRQLMVF